MKMNNFFILILQIKAWRVKTIYPGLWKKKGQNKALHPGFSSAEIYLYPYNTMLPYMT